SSEGEFPNVQAPIFPLAPEAERIYRSGPPLLQRYLPFWLANFFDRMWIVILPLVAALLPLSRVLPPLVVLRLRSRIFRWYRQLRALEDARGLRPAAELLHDLDAIDARVAEVEVPLSYAEELYTLRSHIAMVRARLAA
ncbi:MAG: C4-dicarboxylate ABC transporter substrate-binding protein, partial [Burkholderiales bacterium]|nr:C4-dicarboxylate ABC transporter substrate-binding protein [Burkholderiales bacterium]